MQFLADVCVAKEAMIMKKKRHFLEDEIWLTAKQSLHVILGWEKSVKEQEFSLPKQKALGDKQSHNEPFSSRVFPMLSVTSSS